MNANFGSDSDSEEDSDFDPTLENDEEAPKQPKKKAGKRPR